jgi:murein L,D-transpeptidase YafK
VKAPIRRCFALPAALAAVLALFASVSSAENFAADSTRAAPDRILVLKSERKLFLMAGDAIVKTMDISLGLMPEGPKRREGDSRTPEGRYYIESKNSSSDYFLSLKVSYPNAEDRARARQMGVNPGGQIMIHGLPNTPRYDEDMYTGWDWTDGCIAVSNSDMVDLWRLTAVSMPIEIQP